MKRFFLTIAIVLVMAGWGWSATYYTNTVSGNNSTGDGSSALPWKDPLYAQKRASASDTINIVAPATSPSNLYLYTEKDGLTIQGPSSTNKAYILYTWNISQGNVIGNVLPNASFEDWIDPVATPYLWDISGVDSANSVVRDAGHVAGSYSIKTIKPGATYPAVAYYLNLPAATAMTLSFYYKNATAAKTGSFNLWDKVGNVKLAADKTWGVPNITPADSIGAFTQYTYANFTTNSSGKYEVMFGPNFTNYAVYWEDISLTFDNPVTWSVETGNTYKLPNVISIMGGLLKCSTAEWSASGVAALRPVMWADSLASCEATPGTVWFASDIVYYTLTAAEVAAGGISALHLEATIPYYTNNGTSTENGINILNDNITLSNIAQYGAKGCSIRMNGATDFTINDSDFRHGSNVVGDAVGGSTGIINRSSFSYSTGTLITPPNGDGFDVGEATSNVTFNGCSFNNNMLAGAGSWAGTSTFNYCVSFNNGVYVAYRPIWAGTADGYYSRNATSNASIYNSVAYNNPGSGICVRENGVLTAAINNASYNNTTGDVRATAPFTITASNHNCYGTAYSAEWAAGGGDGAGTIVGNPVFVSPTTGNFHILSNSPCIKTGLQVVGLTTDYYGQTVSNPPNIGASEGMYGGGGLTPSLGLSGQRPPFWKQ